jgi:hypothetical protein
MSKVFDCHGKTYFKVEEELENWILMNQDNRPLHIITGRSDKMKDLVIREIEKYSFKWVQWHYNPGLIIVV